MTCTKGFRWSSSTDTISCNPSTHSHTQHVEHFDTSSHAYCGAHKTVQQEDDQVNDCS